MLWRTHVLVGSITGTLIGYQTGDPKTIFATSVLGGITGLIADIDSNKSMVGRVIPILPSVLKWTVGHRGPFHSILFAVIISFTLVKMLGTHVPLSKELLQTVIFASYLSHPLVDIFDSESKGCPLLWPLPIYFRVPLISTGGFIERILVFPAVAVAYIWVAWPALNLYGKEVISRLGLP